MNSTKECLENLYYLNCYIVDEQFWMNFIFSKIMTFDKLVKFWKLWLVIIFSNTKMNIPTIRITAENGSYHIFRADVEETYTVGGHLYRQLNGVLYEMPTQMPKDFYQI